MDNIKKQDFVCTDANNGGIYMNVEIEGSDEFLISIKGLDTEGEIIISKYDAVDLSRFIQKHFYCDNARNIITEEWLLAYGFEKKMHLDDMYYVLFPYNNSKIMVFKDPISGSLRANLRVYDVEASTPLYFINEIKNLYYSLTKSELVAIKK